MYELFFLTGTPVVVSLVQRFLMYRQFPIHSAAADIEAAAMIKVLFP